MTTPHKMTPLERLDEVEAALQVLEQVQSQNQEIVATAVLASLQEHRVLEEVINRTVAAVEAEWTGKFLPELRRTIKADVMEALRTGSL